MKSDPSSSSSSMDRPASISAAEACSSSYDIIVVGCGVLGSALSFSLANSGRRILVIERDLAPPNARIVGELLQPGGCIALDKLGLLDALEGIDAVPCKGYVVLHPTLGKAHIPYPDNSHDRFLNSEQQLKDSWNETEKFQGRSFHHGAFVGSLRRKLIGVPNLDILEATVNELVECDTAGNKTIGVRCTPKETGEKVEILAPLTIISDGYASKFRKLINPTVAPAITRSYFVGVELENCDLPMPGHGHVVLPASSPSSSSCSSSSSSTDISVGPVLLYALSPTTTRMLIDISTSKTPTKSQLLTSVTSLLPSSVQPSFVEAVAENNPQKVKSMPNSFLPPSKQGTKYAKEGVLLAGDAMNMRHPLTGGGMTVALNDAVLLTQLLGGRSRNSNSSSSLASEKAPAAVTPLSEASSEDSATLSSLSSSTSSLSSLDTHFRSECDLEDWSSVSSRLEEWHWRRKSVATCINVLAMALYSLFGADGSFELHLDWTELAANVHYPTDENLDVLRRGCLKYFHLGGEAVDGPVSLLSALNPSPPLLLYHFFAVAFYSIYLLFTELRTSAAHPDRKATAPSYLEWPYLFWKSIIVFITACQVILPVLWSEVDF